MDTDEDMKVTLDAQRWDALIPDNNMPQFSASMARGVLTERGLDTLLIARNCFWIAYLAQVLTERGLDTLLIVASGTWPDARLEL